MPKRGENIHKRKDGRWEARYKKGVDEYGHAIYGSVYAKTYREAKAKQLDRINCVAVEKYSPRRSPLFEDILDLWLEDSRVRLKGATVCRYNYLIQTHIIPELGKKRVDQLTAPEINIFLAGKLDHGRLDGKGGLSESYVRSIMLIIQSALSFAASQQLCHPLHSKINKPSDRPKALPVLGIVDQRRLEWCCLTDVNETKIGILLSLYTGLRIGEICALAWADVDLDEQIVHVRHTISRISKESSGKKTILIIDRPKTNSSLRDVPLCSRLKPLLCAQKQQALSEYVISEKPGFISPRTYEYRYHKILRDSGIDSINYHALRHTFATRCIESGMDVKTLSEILGHADASVTLNTYVHSSLERKRNQLEKLSCQLA